MSLRMQEGSPSASLYFLCDDISKKKNARQKRALQVGY